MNKQDKGNGKRGIENWKPVPGYEGFYATADGRIGSEWRPTKGGARKGYPIVELKQRKNLHGYLTVKAQGKAVTVHKLVAASFLGIRPDHLQVCHNDGNKVNNRASNLRYDTAEANNKDKVIHGTSTRGENNNTAKLTEDEVWFIRKAALLCGEDIKWRLVADQYGVSPSAISCIVVGKTWKHIEVQL